MKKILTFAAAIAALGISGARAADQYFSGSGQALNSSSYASGTAGPFSSAFTNGNTLNFWNANGTGTGGTISVVGVTATENFTLTSAAGTLTLGGTANVSSGKTLDFGAQTLSFTSFTKAGTGTMILSGSNLVSGTAAISAGTLKLTTASALGTTPVIAFTGTSSLWLASDTPMSFGGTMNVNGVNTIISDRATAGAGVTQSVGGSRMNLSAASVLMTQAGANVTSGTAGVSVGAVVLASSTGTFAPGAGTLLTVASVSTGNGGAAGRSFFVDGAGDMTVTGNVATVGTGGGNVTKSGAGKLTLAGVGTYTGTTFLNAGTLRAQNAGALGSGAAVLSLAGGTLELAGNSGLSFNRNTTVTGNTSIVSDRVAAGAGQTHVLGALSIGAQTLTVTKGNNVSSGTAGLTFNGTTTLTGAAVFAPGAGAVLTLGEVTGADQSFTVNGAGDMAVTGAIATGAGGVTKAGVGRLTLSGSSTYTGATSLNGGTVAFSALNNLGNGGAIDFAGGTLQYASGNTADISGRTVTLNSGGGIIDTNGNNVTYASSIGNGGAGGITKTGSGTLTLSGSNTYLGATTLSTGALRLTHDNATGAAPSLSITGTASLIMAGDSSLAVDGITTIGGSSVATLVSDRLTAGAGGDHTIGSRLNIAGGRTVAIAAGSNVTTGTAGISVDGEAVLAGSGVVFAPAAGARLTVESVITGNLGVAGRSFSVAGDGDMVIEAGILTAGTGGGTVTKSGAGRLTVSGSSNYTGGTTLNAGSLLLTGSNSAGTGGIVLSGGVLNVDVNNGAAGISNAVVFTGTAASYILERAAGSSLSDYAAASDIVGGVETSVAFLEGTFAASGSMTTGFNIGSAASNDEIRLSDVFSLSGTGDIDFVMQLGVAGLNGSAVIGWLDGGLWVNAVMGNSGAGALAGFYNISFAAFLADNGGSFNGATMLGAYGNDGAGNTWAVLDHNSDFAVIPEPQSLLLIGIGLAGLLARLRRGRRAH